MDLMKRGFFIFTVICLSVFMFGCGDEKKAAEVTDATNITRFIDISGRQIEIKTSPQKIAILPIPWASLVYAIDGSSERIAAVHPEAMTAYTGHLHERMDQHFGTIDHNLIGQNFELNIEGAASSGIDAIVLWKYQPKEAEKINQLGIPAIMIDNADMDSLKKSIVIIGKLLGKPERANKLNAYYDTAYKKVASHREAVAQATEQPMVLFLRNQKLRLQGTDNFIHEVIEMSGGRIPVPQTANSNTGVTISLEEIYSANPDIILLSNFDSFEPVDFYGNKIPGQDWSNVKAVKNHRVYKVPMGLYRWDAPGVETPLMMEWLAQLIQPEIFSDFDVVADTKAFYKDFFDYDLTEEDCSLIFTKAANCQSEAILP